ncbi:MAG: hypothetical protein R3192_08590 [Woeseiaceae bacterium]|nr:hypothetical protein [Woeseiaceae bacterium]
MKKTSFFTSLFATALLLVPLGIFAQDDERASLTDVWYVVPKSGMNAQFEAAAKQHIAFRRDAGDTRNWQSYAAVLGSNPTVYQWRAGGLQWADMDAYIAEDAAKGYSDHWFANVDQFVDHYHHYMEEAEFENSKWPEGLPQRPYYGVTSWKINQAAGMDGYEARVELSKIGIEEGWEENWLWLTRTGGSPMLMVVSELENMAAMVPPEQDFFEFVAEKRSEEEAADLFGKFSARYVDQSFTIWAHRPDLSSQQTASGDD